MKLSDLLLGIFVLICDLNHVGLHQLERVKLCLLLASLHLLAEVLLHLDKLGLELVSRYE